jgi:hypothetical protein
MQQLTKLLSSITYSIRICVLAVASAVILVSCGGGGGSSSSSLTALSGKVMDGPIEGATVCLDLNRNGLCDSNERQTVTGVFGAYSLDISGLDTTEVGQAFLLVSIPKTAKDYDDGGLTFEQAGRVPVSMMAPVNLTTPQTNNINPFTTLVINEMIRDQITEPVANEWVRSRLGLSTSASLNVDYTNSDLTSLSSDAQQMLRAAPYLYGSVGLFFTQCKTGAITNLAWSGHSVTQAMIVAELLKPNPDFVKIDTACQKISVAVLGETLRDLVGGNFAPLTLDDAQAVASRIWWDLTKLYAGAATLFRIDRKSDQVVSDLREGISEFRDSGISADCALNSNCSNYGNYLSKTSMVTQEALGNFVNYSIIDYYAIQGPTFMGQVTPALDYWELGGSGWLPISSQIQTKRESDGSYVFKGGKYGMAGVSAEPNAQPLESESLNMSGLNHFRTDQKFQAGSTGYRLSFKTSVKRYVLSGSALTDTNQALLSTGLFGLVAAYPSSTSPTWLNALQSSTGLLLTFTPTGASAGTLSFRNLSSPNQVATSGGSYIVDIVDGQLMLMITEIPEAALNAIKNNYLTSLADYGKGVRPFFALAPDGTVREGMFTPSSVGTSPMLLNRKALNSVLQALSLCQMSASYANVNCPN